MILFCSAKRSALSSSAKSLASVGCVGAMCGGADGESGPGELDSEPEQGVRSLSGLPSQS